METQPASSPTELTTHRPPTPRLLNLILVLLALSLLAVNAFLYFENRNLKTLVDANPEPSLAASCEYNGTTYQPGESFSAVDGCNSCSCSENGEVACTDMACVTDDLQSQTTSTSDWETYSNNEYSFKHSSYYFIVEKWPTQYDAFKSAPIYVTSDFNFDKNKLNKCPSDTSKSISACILPGNNFSKDADISEISLDGVVAEVFYVYEGADREGVLQVVQVNNGKVLEIAFHIDGMGAKEEANQILSTFEFTK